MKKRNNIVGLLMDKVPRKNRDGYEAKSDMAGDLLLIEIESSGEIVDFLSNHRVFSALSGTDRRKAFDAILDAAVEYIAPGYRPTLLLKVRLHSREGSSLFTPLAMLGMRYARMYAITKDGVRNMKYDRDMASNTMSVAKFIEIAPDMQTITCHCPDDLDPSTYTTEVNGIKVE